MCGQAQTLYQKAFVGFAEHMVLLVVDRVIDQDQIGRVLSEFRVSQMKSVQRKHPGRA